MGERVDRRKAAQIFGRLVVPGTRELPLAPFSQKTSNRLFLLVVQKKAFCAATTRVRNIALHPETSFTGTGRRFQLHPPSLLLKVS